MVSDNLIELACKEALLSLCQHRVGAVIWDKKNIISVGHNYYLKSKRSYTKKFIKNTGIHAEVDAITNARTELKGCSILVVRVARNHDLVLAKPCDWCYGYIKHVGLRWLYYTTINDIVKERVL